MPESCLEVLFPQSLHCSTEMDVGNIKQAPLASDSSFGKDAQCSGSARPLESLVEDVHGGRESKRPRLGSVPGDIGNMAERAADTGGQMSTSSLHDNASEGTSQNFSEASLHQMLLCASIKTDVYALVYILELAEARFYQGYPEEAAELFKCALKVLEDRDKAAMVKESRDRGLAVRYMLYLKMIGLAKIRAQIHDRSEAGFHIKLEPLLELVESDFPVGSTTAKGREYLVKQSSKGDVVAKYVLGNVLCENDADSHTSNGGDEGQACDMASAKEGVRLLLEALKGNHFVAAKSLVAVVTGHKPPYQSLPKNLITDVLQQLQATSSISSVVSFYLGNLLEYKLAPECNYTRDPGKAAQTYKRALCGKRLNDDMRKQALHKLGRIYAYGDEGVARDLDTAMSFLRLGMEAQDAMCYALLADLYFQERQIDEAVKVLSQLFRITSGWDCNVQLTAIREDPESDSKACRETFMFRVESSSQNANNLLRDVKSEALIPANITGDRVTLYGVLISKESHFA